MLLTTLRWWVTIAFVGLLLAGLMNRLTSAETAPIQKSDVSRPIRVLRPDRLPAMLPAERIAIGEGYKPTLARLPGGELIMIFFRWDKSQGYHEYSLLCRSADEGKTWSDPQEIELGPGQGLLGRENWLTVIDDGTPHGLTFTTNHIIRADVQNPTPGTCRATINRSTDGGVTWSQEILPAKWSHTSRNIVQMPDGSLKVGANRYGENHTNGINNRWLTSTDGGLHWTDSRLKLPGYTTYQGREMEYDNAVGFFQESYTYLSDAGELLQWIRLDRESPMYAMHAEKPTGNDNADRLIFTKSTDGGLTWSNVKDFPKYTGTLEPYGQMYPRVTSLHQGRTLMTYTKRSGTPPLGLRAVLSTDGGDTFDCQNDVLILDENTQPGWTSGGGFGNTVQLPQGGLISVYSYATTPQGNERPHVEAVRWRLP
ncbi:MAG: glycoside hydrolase [Pirellulales bacterium]|nr:glycoside hydrolase [Pirellulales bacterium]